MSLYCVTLAKLELCFSEFSLANRDILHGNWQVREKNTLFALGSTLQGTSAYGHSCRWLLICWLTLFVQGRGWTHSPSSSHWVFCFSLLQLLYPCLFGSGKKSTHWSKSQAWKGYDWESQITWLIILNIILSDRLKVNPSVLHMVSGSWVPWEADSETEFRSSLCALGYICGRKREEAG